MRVLLAAVAFSFLSFLVGVAGDLSVTAQAAPQPVARVVIPAPQQFLLVSPAMADPIASARPLRLAPSAPSLKPLRFDSGGKVVSAKAFSKHAGKKAKAVLDA